MPKTIQRSDELRALRASLRRSRVVALLGARQVGKTTLARQYIEEHKGRSHWFDLESPADAARLADPLLALEDLHGLVVLDEVQRMPEVFPILRVLVDRPRSATRFLLLGSASPDLVRRSSESLAGRIAYHHLNGLSLSEVGTASLNRRWLRGGFPRSFLASSDAASAEWRRDFVSTFLERDLPQLGVTTAAPTMRRFWMMVAHRHANLWSGSELARSLGVSEMSVRRYLDVLDGAFVVQVLQPWAENVQKRQVRSPKAYIADSGLLHSLLDITTMRDLQGHPVVGASWEGFLIDQVRDLIGARKDQCYFWRTHAGAELDLLIVMGSKRLGFEFKRTSAPQITPSMRIAMEDLRLDRLDVIYAGKETFQLAPRIRAVAASRLTSLTA